MKKISDYLKIGEAALLLGITPPTLRHYEKTGRLRAYRDPFSNTRLYDKEELEKILASIPESANI